MRPGQSPRTKAQYEKDLSTLARMYCQGKPQWQMAEELGFSPRQIANDLVELRRRWLESSLVDLDAAKSKELAKWDNLESTYWAAWERSLKTKTTKQAKNGDRGTEQSVKQEEREGNPSFLAGVERCIENRCKLMGLIVEKRESKQVEYTHEEWVRACAERRKNAGVDGTG